MPKSKEDEWIGNTPENPFYKETKPVEVETHDGRIHYLGCPKCARGMVRDVKRWRFAEPRKL